MSEIMKVLQRDFPDLSDQLAASYQEDPRLASLIEDYARLREEVDRIDRRPDPDLRAQAELLKRKRLRLKDTIMARLESRAGAAA